MSESSCVFCKIIAGEISSLRVYEDESTLAFLDVGPLSEGHLLVIPKEHYERLEDMSGESVAQIARNLPKLGRALVQATSAPGYNLLQNNGKVSGQVVTHVHFHLIPRSESDELGYRWPASSYPEGRAEQWQQRLVAALQDS